MKTRSYGQVEAMFYGAVEDYRAFQFRYCADEQNPGKVLIFVEQSPDYGSRDVSSSVMHLMPEGSRGYDHPPFLDVLGEQQPDSVRKAMRIAHVWADLTLTYLETGQSISYQIQKSGLPKIQSRFVGGNDEAYEARSTANAS